MARRRVVARGACPLLLREVRVVRAPWAARVQAARRHRALPREHRVPPLAGALARAVARARPARDVEPPRDRSAVRAVARARPARTLRASWEARVLRSRAARAQGLERFPARAIPSDRRGAMRPRPLWVREECRVLWFPTAPRRGLGISLKRPAPSFREFRALWGRPLFLPLGSRAWWEALPLQEV